MSRPLLVLTLLLALSTSAVAADVPISVDRARFVDLPKKGTIHLVSRDPAIDAALNPEAAGATLRIFNPATNQTLKIPLPSTGWESAPPWKRFRFTAKGDPSIKVLLVKHQLLRVSYRGSSGYVMGTPQGNLVAALTIGAQRFCTVFDETIVTDDGARFVARNVPAPGSCPMPLPDNEAPISERNLYAVMTQDIAPFIAAGGYFVGNVLTDAGPHGTDYDPEGQPFDLVSVADPSLELSNVLVSLTPTAGGFASFSFDYGGETGIFSIAADGAVTITGSSADLFSPLPPGDDAVFVFKYRLADVLGAVSTPAYVTVTIHQNGPPVAQPDSYDATADFIGFPAFLGGYRFGNVLTDGGPSADRDPEGQAIHLSSVSNPTLTIGTGVVPLTPTAGGFASFAFEYAGETGTFSIAANGELTLTASAIDFLSQLPLGDDAVFAFDYTIADTLGAVSTPAHVTATIHYNQPPVAYPNSYETDADAVALSVAGGGYFFGDVIANAGPDIDSDPEGHALLVGSVATAALTIGGNDVVLTPMSLSVTPRIAYGPAAVYAFDHAGETGKFVVSTGGAVYLTGSSSDLFSDVPIGQDVVFECDYAAVDLGGLVSNAADVTVTIHGTH